VDAFQRLTQDVRALWKCCACGDIRGSFACCMSEPVRYEVPYRHPIHGLGSCGIPETVTHPSTKRGGRCHAAREGSGASDYCAAWEQHHSATISEQRLDSNQQLLNYESVMLTTWPRPPPSGDSIARFKQLAYRSGLSMFATDSTVDAKNVIINKN
jgi:hypothetical protein